MGPVGVIDTGAKRHPIGPRGWDSDHIFHIIPGDSHGGGYMYELREYGNDNVCIDCGLWDDMQSLLSGLQRRSVRLCKLGGDIFIIRDELFLI